MITYTQVPVEQWMLLAFAMYAVGRFALRYVIDHRRKR